MTPRLRAGPRLDILEGRDAAAVLAVTYAAATRTLTVVGTGAANGLTIAGDSVDPTAFTLTSRAAAAPTRCGWVRRPAAPRPPRSAGRSR